MPDFIIGQCILDGQLHQLIKHLNSQAADLSKPTGLCRIMTAAGSDKGSGKHNYTVVYDLLLAKSADNITRFFELGIGTNYLDIPSNMGADGRPGASLRGWREYLSNAAVFGADIDRRILFNEKGIRTFYVDQLSPTAISEMWSDIGISGFDVIVDDGLHVFEANRLFFEHSIQHLKAGGYFIIEDIICLGDNIRQFNDFLRQTGYEYALMVLPHANNGIDNCLAIVRKNVLRTQSTVAVEQNFWATVESLQPKLLLRQAQIRRKEARVARHAMVKKIMPKFLLSLLGKRR